MHIKEVIESSKVVAYLEKRNLVGQYIKAKGFILIGLEKQVGFKLRKPRHLDIYYFRINKQFRAYGVLDNDILKIFKIDNHQ
ncbi:hypothetical protein MK079_01520 [Candidatus Gracilibacteria bacterium]|nr:hypothetical protein [Candidatus Gracilibacteria bacterium]